MKIIVLEPVKIAGRVARLDEVIDTKALKLTDDFVVDLLVSNLAAEFRDDDDDTGSDGQAGGKKSTKTRKPVGD